MKTKNTFVVYLGANELTSEQHIKINTAIEKAISKKLTQLINDGSIISVFSQKLINATKIDNVVAMLMKETLVVTLLSS